MARTGWFKVNYNNGDSYEGEFKDGNKEGFGSYNFYQSGNIYVGQFKDNNREGRGALYYADGSMFIGDFKNDKLSSGIVYKPNGDYILYAQADNLSLGVMYSPKDCAQYLVSKRDGSDKLYAGFYFSSGISGFLEKRFKGFKYIGSFQDGNFNGFGKYIYDNGNFYIGEFSNDERHGYGMFQWSSGDRRIGKWVHGVLEGRATYYYEDGSYQYETFKNNKMIYESNIIEPQNNAVTKSSQNTNTANTIIQAMTLEDYIRQQQKEFTPRINENMTVGGYRYYTHDADMNLLEGDCLDNGILNGKGKISYTDRSVAEGEFKNNLLEGKGSFKYPDGTIHKGEFHNHKLNGHGEIITPYGRREVGEFTDGKKNGWCKIYRNDFLDEEGYFTNDEYGGTVKMNYGNCIVERCMSGNHCFDGWYKVEYGNGKVEYDLMEGNKLKYRGEMKKR